MRRKAKSSRRGAGARESIARQAAKKKARADDAREQSRARAEPEKHPSTARSRLWDHVARLKSLFIPASLFAFAHRSLSFGRDDQSQQQQDDRPPEEQRQPRNRRGQWARQQSSYAIPTGKRVAEKKNKNKKENDEDRQEYFDQVIAADCLEYVQSLPPEILDCTITCPPSNTAAIIQEDSVTWSEFVDKQRALLEQLYRVTKAGGHLWYVHKAQHHKNDVFHPVSWLRDSPWQVRQEIVWDKRAAADTNNQKFWPTDERIFWLRKEPGPKFDLNWKTYRWGNIWQSRSSDSHLAFPLYFALAILHATKLTKGSLVFDPYGRSGTTAKACQMAGHHFLINETDESKVQAIEGRLGETSEEDKYWASFVSEQIANETLNLRKVPECFISSTDI